MIQSLHKKIFQFSGIHFCSYVDLNDWFIFVSRRAELLITNMKFLSEFFYVVW